MTHELRPLSDLVEVFSGGGAPQDRSAFSISGHPFVRAASLPKLLSGAAENSLEKIVPEVAARYRLRLFPAETVLFAKSGMSAMKGHVYRLRGPAYVVNHLAALVPRDPRDGRFVERALQFESPTRLVQDAAYPSIRLRDIATMRVPCPPRREDRIRIADVLDRADVLRIRRRSAGELVDMLTESLFWDCFPRGPIPPVYPAARSQRHSLGWAWVPLTDVAALSTGHTPDRRLPEYWDGDIPWITLTDIRRLDGKVALDTSEHITELGERRSSAVKLPAGTVCFSRTASVGFVTLMGREMATSQDFVNWTCGPSLHPVYLLHALIRSRASLKRLSDGSTHKTIYFPTVERFRVLVPPLELQELFARRIHQLEETRDRLSASSEGLDELTGSLRKRMFAGAS